MHPNGWHLTHGVDDFLARAGTFLRTRPALHSVHLTVTETLRTQGAHAFGPERSLFGFLERAGGVAAAFFRTPPRPLCPTRLTAGDADALAARLAGQPLPGVSAEEETADVFAAAWQRHTGDTAAPRERLRLYRLGELTPPTPRPAGRARVAGPGDRDLVTRWMGEFAAAVGEPPARDGHAWADVRIAGGRITLWEAPDGTPAAMAGVSPLVAGQVRVAPVYTPEPLRGRGYGAAVSAAASRRAVDAGAGEVVLFADLANPVSNGVYQRIGYLPVADFAVHDFAPPTASGPCGAGAAPSARP
ncbi:GNAT family N-acetyltransferase [Streptomyces sp. ODS05-4]|uniref:GNAT family N-acetyltransferase n=1 Tax=Streptomyces sp. ODS05-4 TaxID=2944939 RepID=UPI00210AF3A4|nr:GNAT family N-acetyltransferase [Streptomyces sp. ODS05-4]